MAQPTFADIRDTAAWNDALKIMAAMFASGKNPDGTAFTLATDVGALGTDVTASAMAATNTATSATLAAASAKTTYIAGFEVTVAPGTAGPSGLVTITGTIGGTLNYQVGGASTDGLKFVVEFSRPIPASAVNTAIVVNVPQFGATSGAVAVTAHGYQL